MKLKKLIIPCFALAASLSAFTGCKKKLDEGLGEKDFANEKTGLATISAISAIPTPEPEPNTPQMGALTNYFEPNSPLKTLSGQLIALPSGAKYYKDIPYVTDAERDDDPIDHESGDGHVLHRTFDIILPKPKMDSNGDVIPSGLVLYVFGGGFTKGNKTQPYTPQAQQIKTFLNNNVAFATVDYRYLWSPEYTSFNIYGLKKCFYDVKDCLQFIRYYATNRFSIAKDKILLSGGSAGAGISMWIAFNGDNLKVPGATGNDIARLTSTRVKGVIVQNPQASYDFLSWDAEIFPKPETTQSYINSLLTLPELEDPAKPPTIPSSMGYQTVSEMNANIIDRDARRNELNVMKLMSNDDPEIRVNNEKFNDAHPGAWNAEPPITPTEKISYNNLLHSASHSLALKNKIENPQLGGTGLKMSKFNLTQISPQIINPETDLCFVLRVLFGTTTCP